MNKAVIGDMGGFGPEADDSEGGFIRAFAGYRNLKRRQAAASSHGVDLPFFQPRDGVSGSMIRWHGQELINYSGYNYLGLSGHPAVAEAAKAAIDKYGTSASASRIVSGQIELHNELEKKLAAFLGTEDALTFVSGYLTNVTVISHLLSKTDAVIYDTGAHNSIMTGAKLSGAHTINFVSREWDQLDEILKSRRSKFRRGLLVGEGLYSMDGHILDLKRAVDMKQRHDLILMVDEAHSIGTLGKTGRGICEASGLPPSVIDVHMGTLSKTFAGAGGYIAGDKGLIEYLRFLAPGFIFSVGLSPPDTAAAIAALDVLDREPNRPDELREKVRYFRELAHQYGLPVTGDALSPIASLVVGDDNQCMLLSQRLLAQGVHVQPIIHPAVAIKSAALRFFITRDHTPEQFQATIPLVARELELVSALGR